MRERKTRLPFLDSQTGIAQNPSKLYMSPRHRMPGTVEGQLYVYPSQRWCRRKRSYMALAHQASKEPEGDEHTIVTVENPAAVPQEDVAVPYENKPPSSRGRKKKEVQPKAPTEGDEETPGKPYECQLLVALATRPRGSVLPLSRTHIRGSEPPSAGGSYQPQAYQPDALAGLAEFQDSYLGYLSAGQDASPTAAGF
ncbi:putative zinc finger protein DPF3 isoform X1 [Penaeus vannamei]|uniref:Putative zinc finger protein DPF3 isoform X1 n=1 Tax=Penaeus vannamei TaxID=6689 RepID=A0A3R7MJW1_PENVA|nr:putative zinc finger protein DPF3 isoform X1 [Penaeus vannamei]